MGMGLSSGFGAGAGADQLETILTRKFHEAQAIKQAEQQAQAMAMRQQEAAASRALQERQMAQQEAYQSGQLERQKAADIATGEDRKTQRDLMNEQRFLSRLSLLPKGSSVSPNDAAEFEKYGASGLLSPEEASAPRPSADFVGPMPSAPTGRFRFAGTQADAEKEAAAKATAAEKAADRALRESESAREHGYRLSEIGAQGAETRKTAAGKAAGAGTGADAYRDERNTRVLESVNELKGKVSPYTTGAGSLLSYLPGTAATNFDSELNTLKANIAFNELTEMRAASKTGGALGQVSDKEGKLLESSLGALNTRMSPAAFTAQLNKIQSGIERWQRAKAGQTAPSATPGRAAGPGAGPKETPEQRIKRLLGT